MISFRRARLTDIGGIADVVEDVWQQGILTDVCEAQIEGDSVALWVATDEAGSRHTAVVGFSSAFLTRDAGGLPRWEVDLVAVRRDSRGQGVGTQLISQMCKVGERKAVSLARALIRVDNVASKRAFENAGFTTDDQSHQLLLWTPEPGPVSMPRLEGIALLPVATLTYRGLWIEGLENLTASEQRAVVGAARAMIARDGRLNTGTVIPKDKEHHLAADVRNQARVHGEYLWFVKPGRTTRNVKRETSRTRASITHGASHSAPQLTE